MAIVYVCVHVYNMCTTRVWYTCTYKYYIISKTTWNTSNGDTSGRCQHRRHHVRTYYVRTYGNTTWYSSTIMVPWYVHVSEIINVTWLTAPKFPWFFGNFEVPRFLEISRFRATALLFIYIINLNSRELWLSSVWWVFGAFWKRDDKLARRTLG